MGKKTSKGGRDGSKIIAAQVKTENDDPKKFKCQSPGCTFYTAYHSSLKRHLRRHESDPKIRRPFPCTIVGCSYSATRMSHLESHVRSMHDENNPKPLVVCPLCSAAFHDKQSCTDHLNRIHCKDTAFTCSNCSFRSYFFQHFWRHLETEHGGLDRESDGLNPAGVTDGPGLNSKTILSVRHREILQANWQ